MSAVGCADKAYYCRLSCMMLFQLEVIRKLSNVKNQMCKLCTFSQIQSIHALVRTYYH